MNRERWEQVRNLLESALERPPGERAAFLEDACGGDAELRKEVDSLVARAVEAESLLEKQDSRDPSYSLVGRRLSHYEILAEEGRGGMGIVYRARDTKLGRDVALKVLPKDFVQDPGRVARFEREARVLAALSHPGIATVHEIDHVDGVHFLVMQLVGGDTLAERIARRPLPVEEALPVFRQIAEALEAAHDKGIVHRDLKPANVKVSPEDRVIVLDFGLAKALVGETSSELSQSPTFTRNGTVQGVILGTASYMSPEQARGQVVDKRTDIWSFGCVLYEALTGKTAFSGATVSDTIAAILGTDPDWSALPATTPTSVRALLKRCLQLHPNRRLHDIADARIEIEDAMEADEDAREPAKASRRSGWFAAMAAARLLTTIVLALLLVAIGAFVLLRRHDAPRAEIRQPRSQLTLPRGVHLVNSLPASILAISPDGRHVVFAGCASAVGNVFSVGCQLYLRDRLELDALPIPGTEGAIGPFFSPDGRFVGFGAQGKLKKIDLEHGTVVTLADAPSIRGGSWGEDGTILFSGGSGALLGVPAGGGEVQEVTKPDLERKENDHRWPQLLPGGRAALFEVFYWEQAMAGVGSSGHDVAVVDLETGTKRVLIEGAGCPKYVEGHVLFGRDGIVYAAPFDAKRLDLSGPPIPVLEGVAMWSSPSLAPAASGFVHYDIDRHGTLLFSPLEARLPKRTLIVLDRDGRREMASRSRRAYEGPLFSPEGRRIAVTVADVASRGAFVVDIGSEAWTRVGGDLDLSVGAWTPGGERLLLYGRSPNLRLLVEPVDGSAPSEILHTGLADWLAVAPDGSVVLFEVNTRAGEWDIWRVALTGAGDAEPWLVTAFIERSPGFAPGGRWVAYQSNDSGRDEIYVRPYSGSRGRYQVSTQGGAWPRWSLDGREIFFKSQGSLWSAAVRTSPTFASDPPRKLFDLSEEILSAPGFYDVAPDGQRFVMIEKDPFELRPLELVIVPGWVEEMKSRLAAAK